jgi:hypothetical protein
MHDDNVNDRRYPSDDDSDPQSTAHPTVEQLSAYLDGEVDLDATDHRAIAGHLAHCQDCTEVLAELQTMVHALGTLPEREAPRSFALTRTMIQPATKPAEPVVLQESAQWHARHAAKVRWATAVAAILFVFVVSADLVTNTIGGDWGTSNDSDLVASQPASDDEESISARAMDEAEPVPTAAVAEEAWGSADDAPPALESDVPDSAEVPDSDDAAGDEPAEDTAVLRMPEEDAESDGESEGEVTMFSVEEEAISDEPALEATSGDTDNTQARWRIAQVSLALILALLLAVMIGLPKQRGPRRS